MVYIMVYRQVWYGSSERVRGECSVGSTMCGVWGLCPQPRAVPVEYEAAIMIDKSSEDQRTQDTHGNGAAIVMIPARNAVAPTVPIRSYIWPAKSGKAAANDERKNAFAAIAVAAIGLYADTR